jgi:thiamine-phosphate pyrophosphorylase
MYEQYSYTSCTFIPIRFILYHLMTNSRFELILLHTCNDLPDQHKMLEILLFSGNETLHLRPGTMDRAAFRQFLLLLPVRALSRIVIHGYYGLAAELNLKGIHLTEKARTEGNWKTQAGPEFKGSVSASLHQLTDISLLGLQTNYVFLSPVFPSISKSGYIPQLKTEEITSFLIQQRSPVPVMALGGIDEQRILTAKAMGFQGAVLHGVLLQSENPLKIVDRIRLLLA